MADDVVPAHVNPMVHVIAPLVAIGATMIVRKMLNQGYKRTTGHAAPDSRDPNTRLASALVWTAVTAAAAAVAEVAVYRATARWMA
jgi:hypothetical protein